jgi:thiamine pyrophosphokinase
METNFYYEIIHCDYNWKPSEIPKTNICKVLTIRGFRITPTLSTHYNCTPIIHCQFLISLQQLRISGNYMLKILNDDKDVVFTRKFILYDLVTVPMQVKRTRTVSNVEYKHNLDFSIKSNTITFKLL